MKHAPWVAIAGLIVTLTGCRSDQPLTASEPLPAPDNSVQGKVVGDSRTAMEAAVDTGSKGPASVVASGGAALAANAPDTYVVKQGDTMWAIAKLFLKDPWFWPEIWQVNPQVQNPHLIYPGDVLRLVYLNGQPKLTLERGGTAHVYPRVRSEERETAAITAIPYQTISAFMSKPTVLSAEQIKGAGYLLASRDDHATIADGNTIYARGLRPAAQLGARYRIVHIGEEMRDPDDHSLVGYNVIFTGSARVTRGGDPTTLLMTESARESLPGDKVLVGNVDLALDFVPSPPKQRINGRIMAVNDSFSLIGQYQVVVINRGARDGLAPGNVLAVFQAGAVIQDQEKNGFLAGSNHVFAEKVRLPDERNGTFMVFKTYDRLSYGLIMEAKNIIRVNDRIGNP